MLIRIAGVATTPVYVVLGNEPRALCRLGKHSTDGADAQPLPDTPSAAL